MSSSDVLRVLCVSDDADDAASIVDALERADDAFDATTAVGAGAAFGRLDDADCVVSRYAMDDVDGLALLQSVRAADPSLPFVLFVRAGSEQVASDAGAVGVTAYVREERGPDDALANRVRAAVERYRRAAATARTARARALLDAAPHATLVCVDGECVFANDAAASLFEAEDAAALVGTDAVERVDPPDREPIRDAVERPRALVRPRCTVRTLDGDATAVDASVRRVDWEGTPGAAVVLQARREREAAPRARYRAAFEDAFDAMLVTDDAGRYIDANESACDLFGLPREELLGRSIDEFAPPEYDFEAAWARFRAGDGERGTFPLVRADGTRRTVEYAASVDIVPGEHLSVLRDVTEREAQYETIRRQKAELERFADVVSHDLKSPLATARGYLDLASESGDDEHFERADRALSRMDRIVEDVLWLAREGETIGDVERVDLDAVVSDAWLVVSDDATDATLAVPADLGAVRADATRLAQLLENLFRNAVEHGGEDVTVTVGDLDDGSGFYVADDGPGIPEAEREDVFEYGYTTDGDGTGLGLAIVAAIADAHGWDVSVTASESGGARFEVSGVTDA